MDVLQYRDMIVRAVRAPDGQMLDILAAKLYDSERAAGILQAKGYRAEAKSITALVAIHLVPDTH